MTDNPAYEENWEDLHEMRARGPHGKSLVVAEMALCVATFVEEQDGDIQVRFAEIEAKRAVKH